MELNSREGSVYLVVAKRIAAIYTLHTINMKMHDEKILTQPQLINVLAITWHTDTLMLWVHLGSLGSVRLFTAARMSR